MARLEYLYPDRRAVKNEGDPEIGIAGFNWTVQTYGFDYTDALGSPVFFLAGGSPHGTPGSPGFTSCFINFTNNANDPGLNLSSSTTTLPTSTASPSDTTTSLSDTTTSPSPFLSTFYPFGIPTTTATPTPFSTSTPAPTPTTTQDQSQHATPSHTKLSTGVKAAIGIATVIGFLIMLLLAWMVFRREQRLKRGMVKLKEVDAAPAPPPTDAPARSVSARSGHGTDNAQAAMAAGAVRPVRDAQMAQTARDALGIRSIPGVNDGSAVQDGPAAQDGAAANNGITLDRIHSSREPPQQVEATADSKEEEIMMTPVELQADEEVIPQELPAHGSTPKERWRRFTGEDEGG